MQLSGSFLQSVLHRNLSQASHPIGGVLASPFSNADDHPRAATSSRATTLQVLMLLQRRLRTPVSTAREGQYEQTKINK